jgi:hypothetical protein
VAGQVMIDGVVYGNEEDRAVSIIDAGIRKLSIDVIQMNIHFVFYCL